MIRFRLPITSPTCNELTCRFPRKFSKKTQQPENYAFSSEFLPKNLKYWILGEKIQDEAREEIEKVQKEYYLREQMKAIQKELGEEDTRAAEVNEFREKIKACKMPEEAEKQALRELDRLDSLPAAAAEYGVIRTYLEWLVTLPWSVTTNEVLDISSAKKVLDADHYGLERRKKPHP